MSHPVRAFIPRVLFTLSILAAGLAPAACKNPVDVAVDAAIDLINLNGIYQASDGTEIQVSGSNTTGYDATITRVGTGFGSFPLKAGDRYMAYMNPEPTPGVYRGYVVSKNGFLEWGTVTLSGSRLSIARDNAAAAPAGQDSFNKTASSTPSTPTTPGTPTTPSGSTCQAQWQPILLGGWKANSVQGQLNPIGTGANDYVVTLDFGSTSYREYWKRNNGSGTIYDYQGTYSVRTDANASLINGNRCAISASWLFNGSTSGTYNYEILSYTGGVLEMRETRDRTVYKIVKR